MAWQYDPNLSKVEWSIQYLGIATVKGLFKKVEATLSIDDPDPTHWSFEATIDMASLSSGFEPMDDHVRSADFLDVARYPTATFTSRQIEGSNGSYRMGGVLTLHGVTRDVDLEGTYGGEATDARGRTRRGFSAQALLKRSDFGISSGMSGGVLVAGEEIRVTLDIVANKVQ